MSVRKSFLEASARERVLSVLDPHSFQEFCPPSERLVSPHLAQLSLSQAFDDGIVTGAGTLSGQKVFIAAQEGRLQIFIYIIFIWKRRNKLKIIK
jgi:malonate decarboxylase beta subunit